jgi:hypothetical protein
MKEKIGREGSPRRKGKKEKGSKKDHKALFCLPIFFPHDSMTVQTKERRQILHQG